MMTLNRCLCLMAGLCGLFWQAPASASVIVSLDTPAIAGNTATLDVLFNFSGDPPDTIEGFQISIIGSDAALTANGTDFSRFSFTLNTDPLGDSSNLLSDWSPSGDLGVDGFTFITPNDVVLGPFLSPTSTAYRIGTITVDLSGLATGLYTLTLDGQDPLFPTLVLGTTGGNFDFVDTTFVNGSAGLQVSAVPEPTSMTLACLGAVAWAGCQWRRRRPGKQGALAQSA